LRADCRAGHPDWWNAPVPAFGDPRAWLAIIGLAPGRHGANRTGRPFTGDGAGDLLFATLARQGLAVGDYRGTAADGLRLKGAIIFNVVKCLPPGNRPTPAEMRACRRFLEVQVGALRSLRVVLALGRVAHDAALRLGGMALSQAPFSHGAVHALSGGLVLIDSYHCSRYNQNTGRLTPEMLDAVFARARAQRSSASRP
jgi:uracil-DNA glycosylase family 4